MPTSGNAAARTALPQPPSTSQKVPMNSAASLGVICSPLSARNPTSSAFLLRRDLRDLVALHAETGHQSFLAEDEGIDIVLHRGRSCGLRLALIHHHDAWAD